MVAFVLLTRHWQYVPHLLEPLWRLCALLVLDVAFNFFPFLQNILLFTWCQKLHLQIEFGNLCIFTLSKLGILQLMLSDFDICAQQKLRATCNPSGNYGIELDWQPCVVHSHTIFRYQCPLRRTAEKISRIVISTFFCINKIIVIFSL